MMMSLGHKQKPRSARPRVKKFIGASNCHIYLMLPQTNIYCTSAVGEIPYDQTARCVRLLRYSLHIAQFAGFEVHVRERDYGNISEISLI
jgi:hypothetical protein